MASKKNEWLGFAVNIANALTEKADTRNWQTLPYLISYARVPLNSAENQIEITLTGPRVQTIKEHIHTPTAKQSTRFFVYTTL